MILIPYDDTIVAKYFIDGQITFEKKDPYFSIQRQAKIPRTILPIEYIKGKNVLTTAKSGDPLLWVLQNEPAAVTTYSENNFDCHYQLLKFVACRILNYNDFLEFFYGENALSSKTFDRILPCLPSATKNFWETVIRHANSSGKKLIDSMLFNQKEIINIESAKRSNTFLSSQENYNTMRNGVKKIMSYAFRTERFEELGTIARKFDTIFICDGIDNIINSVETTLFPILNKQGHIILTPNDLNQNYTIISKQKK